MPGRRPIRDDEDRAATGRAEAGPWLDRIQATATTERPGPPAEHTHDCEHRSVASRPAPAGDRGPRTRGPTMSTATAEIGNGNGHAYGAKRDAFIDRLLEATINVWDVFTLYLGERLGLYRALAESGPATS